MADLGVVAVFFEGFCDCFFAEQFREEEGAGCGFDGEDLFGGEAATLESDFVDTGQSRAIARDHRVWRDVLGDLGAGRDECVCADADELMDPAHALEVHKFFQYAVAAELGGVHEDAIVADDAVVRDVHVWHHENVIADDGMHPADFSAAMNRGELANGVVVANLQRCGLAVKFQIRSCGADDRERKDSIALADRGETFDHYAGADYGAGADFDFRPDHRARADFDAGVEFGALVDYGGRMDSAGYDSCSCIFIVRGLYFSSCTSIAESSASAANSSPTRATACIRHSGR